MFVAELPSVFFFTLASSGNHQKQNIVYIIQFPARKPIKPKLRKSGFKKTYFLKKQIFLHRDACHVTP